MKKLKTLFVALALCAPMTVDAQDIAINAENFPDENFRAYLLSQDYGQDGVITKAEIAEITSINVPNSNISSLKGIEHFTALAYLWCYSNQLTALDMSNNTALSSLECWDNQLTALDVSNSTALGWLDCQDNKLTALDVSNSPELTFLYCGNNRLTALDVSNNAELKRLRCNSNQLTTLDVSNNTALIELRCNNNQLTTLDMSNNTTLTDLTCSWNQLAALDVSSNTALTSLYCEYNQLTALDVSNNTALTYLSCYNNQIHGEMMEALVSSLPETTGGLLYVYNYYDEGNVITKSQAAAAKAKGWTPYYFSLDAFRWIEYEGSEDETTSIALPEQENRSATVYTLHGQRVTTPQKGGVYVINGKKVVVK